MSTLYQRRIEQEWQLLQLLAKLHSSSIENPKREKEVRGEVFRFTIHQTPALIGKPDHFQILDIHAVSLYFPKFFPSTPIEANLGDPVFHPNVHPENGFVCLWNRFSPGDTVMEAISQLQQVITWKLVNQETDHLMQPDALAWYKDPARKVEVSLAYAPITKPTNFQQERTYAVRPPNSYRKRLE
jgi:ubiquitin-protein ligase